MRTFTSGATRDANENKPDPSRYFSPLVFEARCEYMQKHAIQPDGSKRAGDNWKKGFGATPEEHYDTCFESYYRHHLDFWKEHDGYKGRDGLKDAILAEMFNLEAYLHILLKEELDND